FSSRRRHTRFSRDWSSDVCSSDLDTEGGGQLGSPQGGQPGGRVLGSVHPGGARAQPRQLHHPLRVVEGREGGSARLRGLSARELDRRPAEDRRTGSDRTAGGAALAAATTSVSASSATALTGPGFVDGERPAFDVAPVELIDGAAAVVVAHLDETEAAGTAGVAIGDHGGGLNGAVLAEQRLEGSRVVRVRQIAYVDVDECS